jgi:glycosyltransferase involved in cell wall biosynthesis
MKICIASPSFGYGGSNIIAATIGKELAKENEVYYYSYQLIDNFTNLPEEKLFFNRKKENRLFSKAGKGLEMLMKKEFTPAKYKKNEIEGLVQIIEQKKIDIIILNSFIAVTIFAKDIKARFPKIKLIAWMHEDPDYSFKSLARNYPTAFTESLKISDSIVCLSKKAYAVFKKINNNTNIIYNPMVLTSGKKSMLTKNIISFTARLDMEVKGLDYLVEVAKGIPEDWIIKIAGQGSSEEEAKFLELLQQQQVTEKVDYVGPLTGTQLENHYLESSIFLSTSRTEALPLVIIEALSYGLPIISFDHSGAKELLDNGKYGILINDFSVPFMIEKINDLIVSDTLKREYQIKSLTRAKSFEMETIINEWQRILNS